MTSADPAHAATLWTGPSLSFSKAAFANPTLAINQDRLTPDVWITRADVRGLFNAAPGGEAFYTTLVSPVGTRWAMGTLAMGVETLTFAPWQTAIGSNPPGAVNQPMVLHLVADDIYLDITLTSWAAQGDGGGAFSYVRSTPSIAAIARRVPSLPAIGLLLLGTALGLVTRRRGRCR